MPYVHKNHATTEFPTGAGEIELDPATSFCTDPIAIGERIYVFLEDSKPGARDGELARRGQILEAEPDENRRLRLRLAVDDQSPIIPLRTFALKKFVRRGKGDSGHFILPHVTEIAEVRRQTTNQPIHFISDEAADWLDLYHF